MSKIKAVDFANYVDEQKKKLVQHCMEHGRQASDSDSLATVVSQELTFQNENINTNWKVEFLDIDGTMLAPNQYVANGGSVTLPSITPSFDSEYLEFDEWRADTDLTNVTRDVYVLPQYKTKYDDDIQQRPTYLICYFDSTHLNPGFYFGEYSASNYVNAYIDFGDGSTPEQITSNSKAHTYASAGMYTIKIWGDKYSFGGSYGLFTSQGYAYYCLQKAYLGENVFLTSSILNYSYSLEEIVYPKTLANTTLPNGSIDGGYASCLRTLVLPKNITTIGDIFPLYSNLKAIIFPEGNFSYTNQSLYLGYVEHAYLGNCVHNTTSAQIHFRGKSIVLPTITTSSSSTYTIYIYGKDLTKLDISNYEKVQLNMSYCFCNIKELIVGSNTNFGFYLATSSYGNLIIKNLKINGNMTTSPNYITGSTSPSASNPRIACDNFEYNGTDADNNRHYIVAKNVKLNAYFKDFVGLTSNEINNPTTLSYRLETLTLANDWNTAITIPPAITDSSLIGVCKSLKNKTGETALTLTLPNRYYKLKMSALCVDANGDEAESTDTGAMTLLEYVQSKNWTVTFV